MRSIQPISLSQVLKRRQDCTVVEQMPSAQTLSLYRKSTKLTETYNIIDKLIKAAVEGQVLSSQLKNDILAVIATKTCLHLNKDLFWDALALYSYEGVRQLKAAKSYFVLRGVILIYRYQPKHISKVPQKANASESYATIEEYQHANCQYQLQQQYGESRGYGFCFKTQKTQKRVKIVAVNAVIVCVQNLDTEVSGIHTDSISKADKIVILEKFPVLQSLGKRIHALADQFKMRTFARNQTIYKQYSVANAVYFILSGEISFSIGAENGHRSLSTQTLSTGNYFGEEQLLERTVRNQTAKCISAGCEVLCVGGEAFSKMTEYNFFRESMERAAQQKQTQRRNKIVRCEAVLAKMTEDPCESRIQMMHGNTVRSPSLPKENGPVNFSMLQADPDMYQSVLKKFRRYTCKPRQKYKPQPNWDVKRVWKVLHLDEILKEDVEVHNFQGRKYYDSYKRYMQQLHETKSTRPKTSGSNYRTKLQYIAFLQKFNN